MLRDALYRNVDGKQFVDFTADLGLRFDARISQMMMGCVVADYDCDGCLDYYILYQSHRAVPTDVNIGYLNDDVSGIENQLWQNDGEGHFVDDFKVEFDAARIEADRPRVADVLTKHHTANGQKPKSPGLLRRPRRWWSDLHEHLFFGNARVRLEARGAHVLE